MNALPILTLLACVAGLSAQDTATAEAKKLALSDGKRQILAYNAAYTSRYRFAAFDGKPDPGILDALWKAYARPTK